MIKPPVRSGGFVKYADGMNITFIEPYSAINSDSILVYIVIFSRSEQHNLSLMSHTVVVNNLNKRPLIL